MYGSHTLLHNINVFNAVCNLERITTFAMILVLAILVCEITQTRLHNTQTLSSWINKWENNSPTSN